MPSGKPEDLTSISGTDIKSQKLWPACGIPALLREGETVEVAKLAGLLAYRTWLGAKTAPQTLAPQSGK